MTRCGAAVAAVVNRPCRTVVEALREPSPHAVSMVTLKPGVGWVRSTLAHPPPVGGGGGWRRRRTAAVRLRAADAKGSGAPP